MRYLKIVSVVFFTLLFSSQMVSADVGIIVALTSTFEHFSQKIENRKLETRTGREFLSGTIRAVPVVLVRSPMGKVNNAITAQILLCSYHIDSVISISPAGAISDDLIIGDGVIATEAYQHDFGTIAPYGFIWNRVPDGTSNEEPGYHALDEKWRKSFSSCFETIRKPENKLVSGIIVSGDQFISSQEKRKWLGKKFKASAVDMGAAAIALVCYENRIPVSILRIITDKAGVGARADFGRSASAYQSDLDIMGLVECALSRNQK